MNELEIIDKKRRDALRALTTVSILPLLSLAGCGGSSDSSTYTSSSTDDSSTDDSSDTDTSDVEWAAGGTDLITEDFPDDSLFTTSSVCDFDATGATIEGPCYFEVAERQDISEGKTGLPMMLCLQLIDSNCNALSDYEIEVWHCDTDGIYSADTSDSPDSSSFAGTFCTGGDSAAEEATWFRGIQTTDSSGRVNFKSCFPGWYSGRTIHIHFRVRRNGVQSVVSQFCFTDAFTKTICTTHSLYSSRGEQDTTLAGGRDMVFGSDYENYLLSTEKNADGSLLAYKTIQIA